VALDHGLTCSQKPVPTPTGFGDLGTGREQVENKWSESAPVDLRGWGYGESA
jgi:hypothetical protein